MARALSSNPSVGLVPEHRVGVEMEEATTGRATSPRKELMEAAGWRPEKAPSGCERVSLSATRVLEPGLEEIEKRPADGTSWGLKVPRAHLLQVDWP